MEVFATKFLIGWSGYAGMPSYLFPLIVVNIYSFLGLVYALWSDYISFSWCSLSQLSISAFCLIAKHASLIGHITASALLLAAFRPLRWSRIDTNPFMYKFHCRLVAWLWSLLQLLPYIVPLQAPRFCAWGCILGGRLFLGTTSAAILGTLL